MTQAIENFRSVYGTVHVLAEDLEKIAERKTLTLAEADRILTLLREASCQATKLRSRAAQEPEPKIGD